MSFPTLQVRPNEKNPKVLRAHEFLRQTNQLVERGMVTMDGRKSIAKMLSKMATECRAIYALDEKMTEGRKTEQMMDRLKTTHQSAMAVMEDRFVNADRMRQVQEKKLEVQQLCFDIDNLRISVQSTKAESKREKAKYEDQLAHTVKAKEELVTRSASVLKNLENSADVDKLRKMEEEKKRLEVEVEKARVEKQADVEEIRTKNATLKAEAKKSFKKTVIECAKLYKLHQSLTPKLAKSRLNVEGLKEEEEQRRASGSLDDTIPFDRSFVLASMERAEQPQPAKSQSQSRVQQVQQVQQVPPVEQPPPPLQEPSMTTAPAEIVEEEPTPIETSTPIDVDMTETVVDTEVNMEEEEEEPERTTTMMETQRVVIQEPEQMEEEEADEPDEPENDRSMDVMEQNEPEEEDDEQNNMTLVVPEAEDPVVADSQMQEEETDKGSALGDSYEGGDPLVLNERPASESSLNREDNFSFNFFGNTSNKELPAGAQNVGSDTQDSDMNFDFNFGNTGDDGSNNGSGGFDFLGGGSETDGNAGASNSDPFGFGTSGGNGGGGGGDTSFNFNFDAKSGDGDGAGNDFFNF